MCVGTSLCCAVALSSAMLPTAINSQSAQPLALPKFVPRVEDVGVPGWTRIALKTGDLDGDDRPDVAVLMRLTSKEEIRPSQSSSRHTSDDTNPFVLAIGLARPNGYQLIYSRLDLFPSDEAAPMRGDDVPDGSSIEIRRNVLTLFFGHVRGFDRLRFRWDGKVFGLIGYDCAGVVGGEITTLSANYLTRIARYTHAAISDDREKASLVRIAPGRRPSLDQLEWIGEWSGQDTHGNPLGC